MGKIIQVGTKVEASKETLPSLAEPKDEKQFKAAIGKLKKGFPESLLIDGCTGPFSAAVGTGTGGVEAGKGNDLGFCNRSR